MQPDQDTPVLATVTGCYPPLDLCFYWTNMAEPPDSGCPGGDKHWALLYELQYNWTHLMCCVCACFLGALLSLVISLSWGLVEWAVWCLVFLAHVVIANCCSPLASRLTITCAYLSDRRRSSPPHACASNETACPTNMHNWDSMVIFWTPMLNFHNIKSYTTYLFTCVPLNHTSQPASFNFGMDVACCVNDAVTTN